MTFAPQQFVPHRLAARERPSGSVKLASSLSLPFGRISDQAGRPATHQLDLVLVALDRDSAPSSGTVHPAILARPLRELADASVRRESDSPLVATCEERAARHRVDGPVEPVAYMKALAGFKVLTRANTAQRRTSNRSGSGKLEPPPFGATLTVPIPCPSESLTDEDALSLVTQAFHLTEISDYLNTLETLRGRVEWQVPMRTGRTLPNPREQTTSLLSATFHWDSDEVGSLLRLWRPAHDQGRELRFVGVLDARTTARLCGRTVHHQQSEERLVPGAAAAACQRVFGTPPDGGSWNLVYPWVADEEYSCTTFRSDETASEPQGGSCVAH